ncbi:MAG: precorrin-6B C5,15-methyltransferase / cobalt-precorrin-6B C5,C15-methyltransferase [Frankiaceae bacterium]|nr:precorrin-6B C5,15-methyltransferase / cobalt-precorrin-6B C5,C15-methyltransferase [Frankiaceae bacterium]
MITVIGYDGSALSPRAADRLASATLVVGAQRLLEACPPAPAAVTIPFSEMADLLAGLRDHDGEAAVLASGDPGFFGIVRALRAHGLSCEVLPATTSVALAFARAGLPWDDAVVVSAHGRDNRDLRTAINVARAHPKVAILCGPGATAREIGAELLDTDRRLLVAQRLCLADESVVECSPAEAAARDWDELAVVLVLDEGRAVGERKPVLNARRTPSSWALPEAGFEHRDGQITKAEVRALVLARLGPGLGDLVWDIGAGSGSVAIECARLGAAVVAVEKDPDQVRRIVANAAAHSVDVRVVEGAAPAALLGLPEPDAIFVGGSGPAFLDVLGVAAARARRTVVVALAAIERVVPAQALLVDAGYAVETVLLQASRLTGVGDLHRLAAQNPVFVVSAVRQ